MQYIACSVPFRYAAPPISRADRLLAWPWHVSSKHVTWYDQYQSMRSHLGLVVLLPGGTLSTTGGTLVGVGRTMVSSDLHSAHSTAFGDGQHGDACATRFEMIMGTPSPITTATSYPRIGNMQLVCVLAARP